MSGEAIALLAVAVTLAIASISAMGWMIAFTIKLDAEQHKWREAMRSEFRDCVSDAENRITRRLERIEQHSIGLRRASGAWRDDEHG